MSEKTKNKLAPARTRSSKKATKSKRGTKKSVKEESKQEPTVPVNDSYIHPYIVKLSNDLKSGVLTAEEKTQLPTELLPFIETLNLLKLAEVLKRNTLLYFDPIVRDQIFYLRILTYKSPLWDQLGWPAEWDANLGSNVYPKQVDQVEKFLTMLLEAHIKALFPYRQVKWEQFSQSPGPPGGLKNPHPLREPWTKFIDAQILFSDFRFLKEEIKLKKILIPPVHNPANRIIERISQQAMEVLEESQIYWSGLKETIYDGPPFDPNKPEPKDSKTRRNILFKWYMRAEEKWKPFDLKDDIKKMCSGNMGRKNGKSAYLAYAILGHLLDVTPEMIRDKIDNYRRTLPSAKKNKK